MEKLRKQRKEPLKSKICKDNSSMAAFKYRINKKYKDKDRKSRSL